MKKFVLFLFALAIVLIACRKEELHDTSSATFDDADRLVLDVNEFPYQFLSSYRFFKGPMAEQRPVAGVLPYVPITPLFTDYAHKHRFVWMPAGVSAQYNGDGEVLEFPDGSVLIKNFYYDRVLPADGPRIIETRMLYKRNGHWEFADYVWNEEQTEAVLDLNGSTTPVTFIDDNGTERSIDYRIPAEAECFTCHKQNDLNTPIGPKPQSLNAPFDFRDGARNQLIKWVEEGYLAPGYPKNIKTTVRWDDESADLSERARSYIDMNCAHCHRENSHCDYRPMRFAYNETTDPVNLGECVPPDDPIAPSQTHIVSRGNPGRSMLYYRITTNEESERMPLLGRTIIHEEGVALIEEWINSLSPPCN
ncbi:MAG: hypothetical protein KDC00_10380 [Flavobacteriales bacterium]|nr:hypothetical protein [Flavobacteriales bacterium]